MLRKNVAPVVATILSCLLFIIIGSCFSAFLYKNEIIKVENPKIFKSENIIIYEEKGEDIITEIKLSKMKLGLKPATGEEDSETNIPSTIVDKQGSEGHYAKIMVMAPEGCKIVLSDIVINSKCKEEEIKEERKNIMVAIKEIKNSAKNLSLEQVELGIISPSNENIPLTFYVWLSGKASDILEASIIKFKVNFLDLN